ncbi:MAG: hypothetical protein PGN11_09800 [Quadrisphaera sp.]
MAGALIGLAAGVRPAAALVVVAIWLVVLLGRRSRRGGPSEDQPLAVLDATAATAAAVLAGGLITLVSSLPLGGQDGGSRWWDGSGGAGFGSLWLLPGLQGDLPDGGQLPWSALPAGAVTALAGVGLLVVVLLAAAAAARTAGADPVRRLAAVALVLVAGGLAVSPQRPGPGDPRGAAPGRRRGAALARPPPLGAHRVRLRHRHLALPVRHQLVRRARHVPRRVRRPPRAAARGAGVPRRPGRQDDGAVRRAPGLAASGPRC